MFSKSLARQRSSLSSIFNPRSLRPDIWWDANVLPGIASASGDPVASWPDISGNGNVPTQSTAANKPALELGVQNGLAVLRFDGVSDYMSLSAPAAVQVPSKTVFLVTRLVTNGATATWPLFSLGATNWYAGVTTGSDRMITSYGNAAQAQKQLASPTVVVGTSGCTVCSYRWTVDPTLTNVTVEEFANGALVGSAANVDGISTTYGSTLFVGALSSSSNFGNVDIGEVIYFSRALSNYDRQHVENYLRKKWGTG